MISRHTNLPEAYPCQPHYNTNQSLKQTVPAKSRKLSTLRVFNSRNHPSCIFFSAHHFTTLYHETAQFETMRKGELEVLIEGIIPEIALAGEKGKRITRAIQSSALLSPSYESRNGMRSNDSLMSRYVICEYLLWSSLFLPSEDLPRPPEAGLSLWEAPRISSGGSKWLQLKNFG